MSSPESCEITILGSYSMLRSEEEILPTPSVQRGDSMRV